MDREQSVIDFYVLCNKLKDVIRTGWKNWNVTRDRVESVAEHIYGVQMLAIAMWSQDNYVIDIKKVILMLAVHELEETVIGDLTQFQIGREEKAHLGHQAIHQILSPLNLGTTIEEIILEFDDRKSAEAQFAYQCDKLECDIQCKLYDEQHCVDLNNQEDNTAAHNQEVAKLLEQGLSWSNMWLSFDQQKYSFDANFLAISNYVKDHTISK